MGLVTEEESGLELGEESSRVGRGAKYSWKRSQERRPVELGEARRVAK